MALPTPSFCGGPDDLNERIEAPWRGRAQALLSLMNQGLGGGVTGFLATGYWFALCRAAGGTRWTLFGALAVVVALGN